MPLSEELPDPDREAERLAVLDEMIAEAAFDGWTDTSLARAARLAGVGKGDGDVGHLRILFPKGVRDVLRFWSETADAATATAYANSAIKPARIRDKITWLVRYRVTALAENREAARRAAATLMVPGYADLGPKLAWATADAMWRSLGDRSLDGNYYSKRATLSAVYLSTMTRWFADDGRGSPDPWQATWDFLDHRIDGVMRFEKWKAEARKLPLDPEAAFGFLGRLRYGAPRR
jgi:ubiquinone biosynthesis protein COQ9